MKVHWRYTHGTRNTYAALYAACEREGISLPPVSAPARDITCYSLNALNAENLLAEIEEADCITIAGGPYATACFREVAKKAVYVVVGEGEYRLPTLLSAIETGKVDLLPGVATSSGYKPADTVVRLDAWPPFSRMKGNVEMSRGCPFSCAYCQTPRIFGHYLTSISLLLFALNPAINAYPTAPQLIRIACSIYLVYMAVTLWRSGGPVAQVSHPITFRRVLLTTLMNPKNLIYAFGIFPLPCVGFSEQLPYLAGFSAICIAVACGWIATGALLHSKFPQTIPLPWLYRGEALLLTGFAIVTFASAYY